MDRRGRKKAEVNEPMTRERLAEYRNNRIEIKQLDYILKNRWKDESMVVASTVMDYRKGYPVPRGVTGFDYERYERLQKRDLERLKALKKECEEVEQFVEGIENDRIRMMFRMYFIEGTKRKSQREIAEEIGYDRSVISKKINRYIKMAHKSQKEQL